MLARIFFAISVVGFALSLDTAGAVNFDVDGAIFEKCNGTSGAKACFLVCKKYENKLGDISKAQRSNCVSALNNTENRLLTKKACGSSSCIIRMRMSSRKALPASGALENTQFMYAGSGYSLTILAKGQEVGGYRFYATVSGPGASRAKLENNCSGNGCDGWEQQSGNLSISDITMLSIFEGKDIILNVKG